MGSVQLCHVVGHPAGGQPLRPQLTAPVSPPEVLVTHPSEREGGGKATSEKTCLSQLSAPPLPHQPPSQPRGSGVSGAPRKERGRNVGDPPGLCHTIPSGFSKIPAYGDPFGGVEWAEYHWWICVLQPVEWGLFRRLLINLEVITEYTQCMSVCSVIAGLVTIRWTWKMMLSFIQEFNLIVYFCQMEK